MVGLLDQIIPPAHLCARHAGNEVSFRSVLFVGSVHFAGATTLCNEGPR